MLKLAISKEEW